MRMSNRIHANRRWRTKGLLTACLIALFLLTACGDFWESGSVEMLKSQQMHLRRDVITIVQGDSYCLPVSFTPDSLFNQAVFWQSLDTTVCTFVNDTLHALSPGITQVVATATIHQFSDTCYVQVLPPMQATPGRYPYDMILYASVNVHGNPLAIENSDSFLIAAYAGEELRATGRMMQHHDIPYMMMRIESPFSYGEAITLRCYFVGEARFELFPDTLVFTGETCGTLSSLYPLTLDQHAEVYQPVINGDEVIVVPDTVEIEL